MEKFYDFQVPRDALEKLKDPEYLREQVESGKTFQELMGYSQDMMDKLYFAAHDLFQMQRYEDCSDAFVFLTTMNPYVHHYWLGLGMSEHLRQDYMQALIAYGMAVITDVENPVPHFHSASCYKALMDNESALASLELAIECAGDKSEFETLKKQALAARQKLRNRL